VRACNRFYLVTVEGDADVLRHGFVSEFSDLKRNEKPQRVLGDQDTPGLPSLEWLRNKTLPLHAIPATVCFGYDLGCSSEADVR
jgi:hypothetical protein